MVGCIGVGWRQNQIKFAALFPTMLSARNLKFGRHDCIWRLKDDPMSEIRVCSLYSLSTNKFLRVWSFFEREGTYILGIWKYWVSCLWVKIEKGFELGVMSFRIVRDYKFKVCNNLYLCIWILVDIAQD